MKTVTLTSVGKKKSHGCNISGWLFREGLSKAKISELIFCEKRGQAKNKSRGTWVIPSVKRLTLDFCSGMISVPRDMSTSMGFTLGAEPA